MSRKTSFHMLFMIALLVAAILACGGATDQVREASEPEAVVETNVEEDTAEATQPVTEEAEPTDADAAAPTATEVQPTSTPEATATATQLPSTPTPDPEDLQLVTQGFGQDGIVVGYAFIVENPNEGLAIEDSQYQVTILDATGAIADTDASYINLMLPGQTLGVGGTLYLDEGMVADSIEVRLSGGNAVASNPLPTFSMSNVVFHPDDFNNSVTGIVESPYNRDFSDVRVSAILYDDTDNIIGGGFTFVNFIPAESSTGLKMSVEGGDNVARVEVYPVLSSLSFLGEREVPTDAALPILQKSGFGQSGIEVGYGLLVENANANYMIESLMYRVTAYAADGTVLGVDESYAPLLFPQQSLGIGGDLFLTSDQPVERLEAQISGGNHVEPDPNLQSFTAEEAVFQQGSYSSRVTGFVVNPYDKDATDLRVSAIAFNEADDIVGGGFTFLDFASASNRTAAEVPLVTMGAPARVELYPTLSSLSDFQ